jgi:ribonuclease VapC
MIVDTSAPLAILFDEPDAERSARALADADTARLSAGNFVEAAIVVEAQTSPRRR